MPTVKTPLPAIEDADDLDGFRMELEELLSVEWERSEVRTDRGAYFEWTPTISESQLRLTVTSCGVLPTMLTGHLAADCTWPADVEYAVVPYRAVLRSAWRIGRDLVAAYDISQPTPERGLPT